MFYEETLTPEWQTAMKIESSLSDEWKFVGEGRHRRVFRRGDVVLKVPYCYEGRQANRDEYSLYRQNKNKNYAPCRLLKNACLMMVAVEPINEYDLDEMNDIPSWAWDLEDGPQIGYRKSKILIYDYADESDML